MYHANKCLNANNRLHFNIYEHDKCYVQLSGAWKRFHNIEPDQGLHYLSSHTSLDR